MTPGKAEIKCDGGKLQGECSGKCQGSREASASAVCTGECNGTCDSEIKGACSGKCAGKCSVELKEPKCSGDIEPPKMSAECKAKCDAHVEAKAECTPQHVALLVSGSTDAKAADAFRMTLEKDLGAVLKVALGTGKSAEHLVGEVSTVVEGA